MILFTPEYHNFSHENFGKYFHHIPASKKEKADREKERLKNPEKAREIYLGKLEKLISITYDLLGEETAKKWFQEYPEKYSKEKILALRK